MNNNQRIVTAIKYFNRNIIEDILRIDPDDDANLELDVNTVYDIECMQRPAMMQTETIYQDGARLWKTDLQFRCCQTMMNRLLDKCFLVDTSDGNTYLIGDTCRPYPLVSLKNVHPEKSVDSQLLEVTVTWTTDFPPLKVIISE